MTDEVETIQTDEVETVQTIETTGKVDMGKVETMRKVGFFDIPFLDEGVEQVQVAVEPRGDAHFSTQSISRGRGLWEQFPNCFPPDMLYASSSKLWRHGRIIKPFGNIVVTVLLLGVRVLGCVVRVSTRARVT